MRVRKLIETGFPVELVGRHASREKSIRFGHPSTLHLWWSRKPLAATRAVLFAQLVDDPGSRPDRFPTVVEQDAERSRLLDLVGRMSSWEATADPGLMAEVRAEIRSACDPEQTLVWDPFAGGGSIPLEGQRLGLPVLASDLNPVAVLLERTLLELPRRWRGRPPVGAVPDELPLLLPLELPAERAAGERAMGLAADLRWFGDRLLRRAADRLGGLYPTVEWAGRRHQVAAYLWVRTVPCGNPVCNATVPMLSNPWLDRRAGREAWLEPAWQDGELTFRVVADGTAQVRSGRGPVFDCLACGRATVPDDVKSIAADRGLGRVLRCVVPDAGRGRPFLILPQDQVCPPVVADRDLEAQLGLRLDLALDPAVSNAPTYGIHTLGDLHLPRQRAAMAVFAAEVRAARTEITAAAAGRGWAADDAGRYAVDLTLLLGLVLGRLANRMSMACIWNAHLGLVEQTFIQNSAIAFPWDFAEANPLSGASGSWTSQLDWVARVIERCDPAADASAVLADARTAPVGTDGRQVVVSTDPPYFDYFLYSSLSDYFYAWLRPALREAAPDLFAEPATPKDAEIVSRAGIGIDPEAFMDGLAESLAGIARQASPQFPVTLYYAYRATVGVGATTAWESFLGAVQSAGLVVTATWPIRTERTEGVKTGRNSLASSIVVVCRLRDSAAGSLDAARFLTELRAAVPAALDRLQGCGIAPVDLDQAALGPGMAVYTQHAAITGPDGAVVPIRAALRLVDQVLTEALDLQRDRLDPITRTCLDWFERYGWRDQPIGPAMDAAALHGLPPAQWLASGTVVAVADRVRLLTPAELADAEPAVADPAGRPSSWWVVLALVGRLQRDGAGAATEAARQWAGLIDLTAGHPLVFLLYRGGVRRKQPRVAAPFNALGSVWRDLVAAATDAT